MYIHLIFPLLALSIPFIIDKKRGRNKDFKLKTLSLIIGLIFIYYLIGFFYNEEHLYFNLFLRVLLAIFFAIIIFIVSPIKKDYKNISKYVNLKFNSKFNIYILIFFFYTSISNYFAIHFHPQNIEYQFYNYLIIKNFHVHPFATVSSIFFTELLAIVGEELVFRYFAINALKQNLEKNGTIFISSLIWFLSHWNFSLGIFLLGILLGYLFYEINSLSLCILVHLIFNITILTQPFILLYNNKGLLSSSSFQYILILFVFQLFLYYFAKIMFLKVGNDEGN